jgi:hypothetical protein
MTGMFFACMAATIVSLSAALQRTSLAPWKISSVTTWAGIFNRNNERVLLLTSMDRETAAYSWHDWATGRDTLIAEHPRADCAYLVLHPTTYEVDAVGVTATRQEWVHIAPGIATDFALLQRRLKGFEFSIQTQTDDNRHWIVMAH